MSTGTVNSREIFFPCKMEVSRVLSEDEAVSTSVLSIARQNAYKKIGLLSGTRKLHETKRKTMSIELNSEIELNFCTLASLKWK